MDFEEYRIKMDEAIEEFLLKYGYSSTKELTQNVFTGLLIHIGNTVFKRPYKDRSEYWSKSIIDFTDYKLLYDICEYYINLCYISDKEINIQGYSKILCMDTVTIYTWLNDNIYYNNTDNDNDNISLKDYDYNKAKQYKSLIAKMIFEERESSLQGFLDNNKRPVVGTLARLNHFYGWNLPGTTKEVKHVASADKADRIAERYKALTDNEN